MKDVLFGGIEAGGTKFCCAVGDEKGRIIDETIIPTAHPDVTLPRVIEYFRTIHEKTPLSAFGIASFGPVDLNRDSQFYGFTTTPPKPGWQMFDFAGALKKSFNLPVGFDTDVNGAALGEFRWGAARGLNTFIYITVGTGIGGGGMAAGNIMHGLVHPEMGHIFIPHDRSRDPFDGICPYHGDCLEGLASGPSIQKRWGVEKASDLPSGHQGWALEADYLAYAFACYSLMISPQRIIAGGGVMKTSGLIEMIRLRVRRLLNGYVRHSMILDEIDNYIVPPGLGDRSGTCGALALAEQAYLKIR
ncbi:MAG TPA: ROK family protein [Desulfomonilia bacterium]